MQMLGVFTVSGNMTYFGFIHKGWARCILLADLLRRLAPSYIYTVPAAISLMRYLLCSFMGSFAWGSAVFIGTFLLGINDTFALLSALSNVWTSPLNGRPLTPGSPSRCARSLCSCSLGFGKEKRQNKEKEWLSFQKTCLLKRRREDLLFSNVRRKEGPDRCWNSDFDEFKRVNTSRV